MLKQLYPKIAMEYSFAELVGTVRPDQLDYYRNMYSDLKRQWLDKPRLRISFEEAALGTIKHMEAKISTTCAHCVVERKQNKNVVCNNCSDKGYTISNQLIHVTVPAGAEDGREITAKYGQNETKIILEV